jgi:hypothetical protein
MLLANKWDSPTEMFLMVNLSQEELMFVLVIMEKTYAELIVCLLLEKFKNVQDLKVPLKNVNALNRLMIVDIILMLLLNAGDLEILLVLVRKKEVLQLELLLLEN